MFDSVIKSLSSGTSSFTPRELMLLVCLSLLPGLMTSFTYIKTHQAKTPMRSFAITLVVLPAIITLIVMMIGTSIARAFSLAGAFQIIRFRSQGDSKDMMFVLFSMATGLCCGMGYVAYAAAISLVLCGALFLLEATKFGKPKYERQLLKITIPENLDYKDTFDGILKKYTAFYSRKRVKTVDLGSLFEIHYIVTMSRDADEKAFIDELRTRNGNLSIILVLDELDAEFING